MKDQPLIENNISQWNELTCLVREARRGNPRALEALLRRVRISLANMVRSAGLGEDTEDVLVTVETAIFLYLPSLKAPEAFYVWTQKICHSVIAKYLLRRAKEQKIVSLDALNDDTPLDKQAYMTDSRYASLERQVQNREIVQQIRLALAQLRPQYRIAIRMHHLEGISVADISIKMGTNQQTVKTWLSRGRIQLRRALASYFL